MGETRLSKTRIAYLDLLRILSGLLVVMVHVSAQQMDGLSVTGGKYIITNAFNCLAFSGVALFVMISGALALQPGRETGIRQILLHKTVHFYVIYYIWKAFYQAIMMLEEGKNITFAGVKSDIVLALIQQRGYYHLWFLPMIAIVYMSVPIIKKGVADKNVCRYFLCIFFIAELLFPTLFHYEFKFKYLFVDFFASNDFYLFSGYLGYFVLGHYLHNWGNELSTKTRKFLYIAGICGFALACVLGTLASRQDGELSYIMNTPFAATTFFVAMAIYIAGQSLGKKAEHSGRNGKVLQFCADKVFGIYLLHPLALNLFYAIGFDTSLCSPVWSIPLVSGCVFIASGLVSAAISQIPVVRKVIH